MGIASRLGKYFPGLLRVTPPTRLPSRVMQAITTAKLKIETD